MRATKRLSLRREKQVKIKVVVVNKGETSGSGMVTLAGYGADKNEPLFDRSEPVTGLAVGERLTLLFNFMPTASAIFTWTAGISDDDPDVDTATATTKVVP